MLSRRLRQLGFGRLGSLLAQLENCITVFDDFKSRAFYIVSFPWTCSFTEHGPFENFNVEVVILGRGQETLQFVRSN